MIRKERWLVFSGRLFEMVKCSFCGFEEEQFRGIHLIKNDGSVDYFCSGKCRKNSLKLKRDKRKLKWTEAYRIALAKSRKKQEREEEKRIEAEKAPVQPEKIKKTKKKEEKKSE